MPRRALRCVVDLNIRSVTAPGVWLPSREDVYLSISVFGQYRNTKLLLSEFPLIVNEIFRFEKTYYTAIDPSQVSAFLEDELVIFELVQLSEYCDGAIRLATFCINARDFLYPYPSLAPTYASTDREILMNRTVAFPGISPKIEFTTKTVIKESISPEVDALEDALEEERSRRKIRGRPKSRQSSARTRSPSPAFCKRMEEIDLHDTIDDRPPFVVRKLEKSLIGRTPGGPSTKHGKSKAKKSKRKLKRSGSLVSLGASDLDSYSYPAFKHQYHLREVIRDPGEYPLPVYESRLIPSDDEDAEVAALTSDVRGLYTPPYRPRSASPILYRPSFSERFGSRPISPVSSSSRLSSRLDRSSPYPYLDYELDDLALQTSLVKSRRYYP